MTNPWVEFLKQWAKQNNTSYACALTDPRAKDAYKRKKEGKSPTIKEVKGRMNKEGLKKEIGGLKQLSNNQRNIYDLNSMEMELKNYENILRAK
jgi:hypothetical protein